MNRREFLLASGSGGALATAALRARSGEERLRALRGQFALSRDVVQLDTFLLAPTPALVRASIDRFARALDADPAGVFDREIDVQERRLSEAGAAYLGCGADELAFVGSTTMGLGLLFSGLRVRPDQELLTTIHDHYACHESLRLKAASSGARLRKLALYQEPEQATAGQLVDAIRASLRPATRVLALTWVHSSTGVMLPLRRIADVVAAANKDREPAARIILCVDGVHGLGVEDVDLPALGCDFFVAGCHKWLFGPRGTGFVWGRSEAWRDVAPEIASTHDLLRKRAWRDGVAPPLETTAAGFTPGGMQGYEARWALADAFDLHRQVGRAEISKRTRALADRLSRGLATTPGVRLRTPARPDSRSGLICFEVAGLAPDKVVAALRARGVRTGVTPYATPLVRAGATVANDESDVEAFLSAMAALRA